MTDWDQLSIADKDLSVSLRETHDEDTSSDSEFSSSSGPHSSHGNPWQLLFLPLVILVHIRVVLGNGILSSLVMRNNYLFTNFYKSFWSKFSSRYLWKETFWISLYALTWYRANRHRLNINCKTLYTLLCKLNLHFSSYSWSVWKYSRLFV